MKYDIKPNGVFEQYLMNRLQLRGQKFKPRTNLPSWTSNFH